MMRGRGRTESTPAGLHRAPIITERLIIREAARADASALEKSMESAGLAEGERTTDGARRFGPWLADVPVWSVTRAVCEKGTANIVGGVVLSAVEGGGDDHRRIGWWLGENADRYGVEVVTAVDARLREMGVDVIVLHVRAADERAIAVAVGSGFRRSSALQHTTPSGEPVDFWEYARP